MDFKLNLPLELEPHRDKFLQSIKPFIKIIPQKEKNTRPWESKIGGLPYLPIDVDFPKNKNGEQLFFLAQINFAEMPPLEHCPQKGILQFYINDDANYGLESDIPDEQNNFRILYFEKIEKDEELLKTEFNFREYSITPILPNKSFPILFELKKEAVPLTDHNIHDYVKEDFFSQFGQGQWEVMSAYSKSVNAGGHKIGGYAFFTQEDPRYEMGEYELLFQLDTDQDINCQWGDMGVANFFIKKEDLIKKDFSEVLFNWDCY